MRRNAVPIFLMVILAVTGAALDLRSRQVANPASAPSTDATQHATARILSAPPATTIEARLHHMRALSEVPSSASGRVTVDFESGQVSAEAQQLPPLPEGASYRLLLVDNRAAAHNSAALDLGPDGDVVIDIGELSVDGDHARLEGRLAPRALRDFELELVALVRAFANGRREFVIGSPTSILQRASVRFARMADAERSRSSVFALLSPPSVFANHEPFGMVEEGKRLFFQETFAGNGRTCGTCHPAHNNFTLDADFIASLPADDPLFVAEFDANLAGLENPGLMRGPRALILENIDGFANPPVFRASPHVFNAGLTAPFGLSGEFGNLASFSLGAVMQHFPLTLNRVAGVDFRHPTQDELDAMEAFQLSVFSPADEDFDPANYITNPQEQSGHDLFFGAAKCSECHGGAPLAIASAALGGGNRNFNTGVTNLLINQVPPSECDPPCSAIGPLEAGGNRKFNTPPLFGVANTAPFFHDNSFPTLRDAVAFYDSTAFAASPASAQVGGISLTSAQIDDIVAFLEALTPCGNGTTEHGEQCDDGNRISGDGCRADCTAELCGDVIVDPNEECDDGNTHDGDCCSATCTIEPAGTVCRDAIAGCDTAETCDGVVSVCPEDELVTEGTTCRAAAGACDVAEVCDGATLTCPSDQLVAAGTECRSVAGACDLAEACDGSTADCPVDETKPDADADTVCDQIDNCVAEPNTDQANGDADPLGDACDPCTAGPSASKPKLVMSKFTTGPGDDMLTFQGTATFAVAPALAPDVKGVRVLLDDGLGGPLVDVTVPPGAFDKVTKTGWKRNPSGTSFTFVSPTLVGGVVRTVTVKTTTKAPTVVKFTVKGSKGGFAVAPPALPIAGTLVLDPPFAASGACSEATFPGPSPLPACSFNPSGSTLTCK